MVQLRRGDIVAWWPEYRDAQLGVDIRIQEVVDSATARCETAYDDGHGKGVSNFHPKDLRLLRRPPWVGDVLTAPCGSRFSVDSIRDEDGTLRERYRGGCRYLDAAVYMNPEHGWKHEDGTPIESLLVEKPLQCGHQVRDVRTGTCGVCMWNANVAKPVEMPNVVQYTVAEPTIYAVPVQPTVEQLARALFETDPRVTAFIDRVAERPASWDEAWEKRRVEATEMAWARWEPKDAYEESRDRAEEMHSLLGGDRSPHPIPGDER
jgi:hypothetical protein